jgi:hypothetical protein
MYFSSVSRTQIDQTKTKIKLENMAAILVSFSVEQLCKRVFTREMEEIRGMEGKNPFGLELKMF